jgi:energy-coupling factor transport system permease protein
MLLAGYFGYVLLAPAIWQHPGVLALSFAGAAGFYAWLRCRSALKVLVFLLPVMLIAAAVNPLFNHRGATILGYLGDNPITAESIGYGVAAAVMIGAMLLWCFSLGMVFDSAKLLYLTGRLFPGVAVVLSMAFRLLPRYTVQARLISQARAGIGIGTASTGRLARVQSGLASFNVLITWALENSIETADSMRSRGFGLKGRSAYSPYRFDSRDLRLTLILAACLAVVLIAGSQGGLSATYYPFFDFGAGWLTVAGLFAHAGLVFAPLGIEITNAVSFSRATYVIASPEGSRRSSAPSFVIARSDLGTLLGQIDEVDQKAAFRGNPAVTSEPASQQKPGAGEPNC